MDRPLAASYLTYLVLFGSNGHPTLVLREYWNEEWTGECADYEVGAILHDLDSGEERMLTCRLPMEDGSLFPESQGGGWFVGALSVSSGASGTSVRLVFWDQSGAELVVQTNPFPESCAPCNIGALISPDGTRLAYYYRPDAKWPPQEWAVSIALIVLGVLPVFGPPEGTGGVLIAGGMAILVGATIDLAAQRSPRFRRSWPQMVRLAVRIAVALGAVWSALTVYVMAMFGGFRGSDFWLLVVPWAVIAGLWWVLDRFVTRYGVD